MSILTSVPLLKICEREWSLIFVTRFVITILTTKPSYLICPSMHFVPLIRPYEIFWLFLSLFTDSKPQFSSRLSVPLNTFSEGV